MKPRGWRIGTIGGTPLHLDRSWPFGVLLLLWLYLSTLTATGRSFPVALGLAAAATLILFLSVLVHEVSHGLAGKALQRPANSYTLTLWGGYTAFRGPERSPGVMALIAAAGPAANLAIALLMMPLAWVLSTFTSGWTDNLVGGFLWPAGFINLLMGLFNLIPGLPMDGGILVQALAWKVTGSRDKGMLAGAAVGIALAVAIGAIGLTMVAASSDAFSSSGIWILLIAFFLGSGAARSLQAARVRLAVADFDLRNFMRPTGALPATAPIAAVSAYGAVLFDPAGQPTALIQPGQVTADLDSTLPAHTLAQVLPPQAVITNARGAEALAAVHQAAPSSDVIVLLADGHAFQARTAHVTSAISAQLAQRSGQPTGTGRSNRG